MTAADVVARARFAIGHNATYALGKGGLHPENLTPWPPGMPQLGCDCSGFVAWCLGVSRWLAKAHPLYEFGGWFETTAVYRDAKSPFGFVSEVAWEKALPGDILVWGDHDGHQGHIGVVSEAGASGPARVVHCSKGNWRATGDAVQETGADIFKSNGAVAANVAWVTREAIA